MSEQHSEAPQPRAWDYYIDAQLGSMAVGYETFMTHVFNSAPYPQVPEGNLADALEQCIAAGTLGIKTTPNMKYLLGPPDIFKTKSA